MVSIHRIVQCLLVALLGLSTLGADRPRLVVDWSEFLARQDMTWEVMPHRWFDAPFLGNGMLGTLVRQDGERQVRWDVGHSYVHDHRVPDDYRVRAPEILNRGRLPIGHFILRTQGKITGGRIRLDLWNAEAVGRIDTDQGVIKWRTLVHADDMVFLVEVDADEGEAGCRFEFVPERAESCRFTMLEKRLPEWFKEGYPQNPDPEIVAGEGGVQLCVQRLQSGPSTATAWHEKDKSLFISVEHGSGDVSKKASASVVSAAKADRREWIDRHRRWWHEYYPQSYVSLPDATWESFYWIQMYKLACTTRGDRALIDNQGPWLQPTGWNGTWWNLNVQLSYSPVYAANRLHLGESLTRHLERHYQNLIDNVEAKYRHDSAGLTRNTSMHDLAGRVGKPGGWEFPNNDIGSEVGNLAWTLHNVYLHFRHSMDEEMMRDLLYPLLKRAVNYYRHFLHPGDDGRLHLPVTHSPEYGNAPDCNYDLSLIRWGCRTLLELAALQGLEDPLIPEWRRILEKLVDHPQNEHGFMIGEGVGYDRSHRHFSHMLMVYPLCLITPDTGHGELILKSLDRWHEFKDGMTGYSFTAGSCIASLLGDGNRSLEFLNGFMPYMGASTMYFEGGRGRALPVMETPLHGAEAVHLMLLQSHGDRIRVFPAVPDAWTDVGFYCMRAEGGFLVSAKREGGRTRWVHIQSSAGAPCRVESDLQEEAVALDLEAGRAALLCRGGKPPDDPVILPVNAEGRECPFGLKE